MITKFLDAYRNLENELRAENKTVLEYENSLQDANIQEKLKLCRITRNYLSHQDTKFASVSKEMLDFLDKLAKEINLKAHTVKDEMKKIKPIFLNENVKNIVPIVAGTWLAASVGFLGFMGVKGIISVAGAAKAASSAGAAAAGAAKTAGTAGAAKTTGSAGSAANAGSKAGTGRRRKHR